ncbi:MAG: putative peptidoglycan lipid flippase, partial [Actinomycetota bacterium]
AHGRLNENALETTASTLAAFALGLPGFSAFILCTRALQARRDTRRVFYLYVVENGINVVLALALYPSLHVRGLAYSYAAAYTVSAALAFVVVKQTGNQPRGLPFGASTGPTR